MFRQHTDIVRSTIRSRWLQIVRTELTDRRITDYAKSLNDVLAWYDPAVFTSAENRVVQQWMVRSRDFLYEQSFGSSALFPTSNWQFYRIWVMSSMTVILKQPDMIRLLRAEFVSALRRSISPDDGSLEDFRHRDSVEYHVYALYAIIRTIRVLGPSYRTTDGSEQWSDMTAELWATVRPAVSFMLRFARGQAVHMEFVRSRVASDRTRPEFNRPFVASKCLYVMRELWDAGFVE